MPHCYSFATIAQAQSADGAQPLIDQGGEDLIYQCMLWWFGQGSMVF
jgi:hypothetical protein